MPFITPGLALLRAAPLLSSTSYITFTLSEDIYLRPFGNFRSDLRPEANRLIPAYKARWFPPALAMIFVLYPLSIGTSIANLLLRGSRKLDLSGGLGYNRRTSGYLYIAGAMFSALHFAFGPNDLAILKRIGDEDKDNEAAMADLAVMNRIRGLVADFPSWICYFAAFFYAIS
ncbi:uncharacterized protein GGS22DRAFT_100281 [Annulohypoxylon maeteangense]|uniref:uncharacterized protein n=1 Tax=Annulohypoxylon maeteangense TaxID=1927788 RepID=UPI0020081CEA|nr:uncharacterized protein GGS22DRAFT_100281 [Annulohypoxylon maeteangense]KAI0880037.1 hypothetical protein GGS22DRAFT_100281 [Annulohypoxylon maeteangense]